MRLTDDHLVDWLKEANADLRSASIELLSQSYIDQPPWLLRVLEAWDRFGVPAAFPEFPLQAFLPIATDAIDTLLERAADLCHGRRLVDFEARCAGKLVEALAIAPVRLSADQRTRLAEVHGLSKIFFRVDLPAVTRQQEAFDAATSDLQERVALHASSDQGTTEDRQQFAADLAALDERQMADVWIQRGLKAAASPDQGRGWLANTTLELLTRSRPTAHGQAMIGLLDHPDSRVADTATLGLVRSDPSQWVDPLTAAFPKLGHAAQLRVAEILSRWRRPNIASRLRLLREATGDEAVRQALLAAELLQFNLDEVEDWLEALLVISDTWLKRLGSRLPLALPLADTLPAEDAKRFRSLFRHRVAAWGNTNHV